MSGKRKYVWHEGTFVDVTDWKPPPRRTPYIIRDGMAAAVHPVTGQVFDSKSRFREVTKAHGLIEVGTERQTRQNVHIGTDGERKQDIAQAIEMLEHGYTPPPAVPVEVEGKTRIYE